ncbi:MAG TPA: HesA/MoeB/ThiF family protein, partial [Desulfomonilia bacterium]|nr:HesA/MoeB/ThiF family protein [Desulfomonilia bacterium]
EADMENLVSFLRVHALDGLVPLSLQGEAVSRFKQSFRDVEEEILKLGLLPERYRKNAQTITQEDQLRLFRSHAAVIGCGGLGGYVIEELARIGIGTITVIDPDTFEEHNLNRQLLATLESLHEPKVQAAARRVVGINPAVTVIPHQMALSRENGPDLLKGVQVAVDGLDSITSRLVLAEVCEGQSIPLVHGSIAGWYGQVTTQYPEDRTLQTIFSGHTSDQGIEQILGNPSFLPAFVASLETAEAVKILLGQGTSLRGRLMTIDLLDMEIAVLPING